ncbi:MAG: hypothetical protein U0V04_03065 [Spirosomataceae bacterium]|jgi:hypothetical protein
MKKILVFFPLLVIGLSACLEVNDIVNPGDKPVIEAYLAPGHTVSMKVFTEIPYTTEDSAYSEPISGLKIKITGSDGNSFYLTETETGVYESTQKLGVAGTTYAMSFEHNGRTIAAETILPGKPEGYSMDVTEIYRVARDFSSFTPGQGPPQGGFQQEQFSSINLTWNNPENLYHFIAAQLLDENATQIVTRPSSDSNFPQRPPRRFNNQPIQTESATVNGQSFEYFGRYAIILYKLNADYAALYENQNTTSQNISTPVSTITNGLGIFTGINADTLLLTVKRQQ